MIPPRIELEYYSYQEYTLPLSQRTFFFNKKKSNYY